MDSYLSTLSILTNFLVYQNLLVNSLGIPIDAIYTDFHKDFDKVNHSLMFIKLKYFSFKRNFLNWLYSYLINIT
jgi:hypothetical protein